MLRHRLFYDVSWNVGGQLFFPFLYKSLANSKWSEDLQPMRSVLSKRMNPLVLFWGKRDV